MDIVELDRVVAVIAAALEFTGVAVLVAGALIASAAFVVRLTRRSPFADTYTAYRADLGRAILLGLEFLVAADIVGTVAIEQTFRSLGVLGLMVLIRTFLSFTLEAEINGRWPWQERSARTASERN